MATHKLASWAVNLQFSSLPPTVVQAAIQSIYNWIGCTIGGSNHPAVTIALKSLSPFFGPATSSILGSKGKWKADAQHAALMNGIASHVHDFDDTHLETIIHPTGPVASAALAYAEMKGGISGEDLILAIVVGIEAECKAGLGVWSAHYSVGWHITSTTGSIGAAVAVSKLMHLSIPETQHAIGLAATQVTGLREMFGSHTKSFHPGRAAQNGLLSAILASNGYTSSLSSLEAKRGWANVVSTTNNVEKYVDSLGEIWETPKNSFKPFPCGIVIHPIIDGCIQLRKDLEVSGRSISDIESLEIRVHPLVLELTGKLTPTDGLQAKFSVYHGGAIGLLFGKATPSQYLDEVVISSEVVDVRRKISAISDETVEADECFINVRFNNGKVVKKHIEHAIGSLKVPMTEKQLKEKFLDQCIPILGEEGAERASEAAWSLEGVIDLRELTQML